MWTHQKEKFRFQKSTLTPMALAILEELYVDERADMEGDEYVVKDEQIVELSDDDKMALELPATYVTGMSVETQYIFQNPKYGYRVRFKNARGLESETAVLDGAYLKIDDREYLLNLADYRLASQLKRWEEDDKKRTVSLDDQGFVDVTVRRERLSRIKEIQNASRLSSVNLSNDIIRKKIVSASKLRLNVRPTQDGRFVFHPSFVGSDEKDIALINDTCQRLDGDALKPEIAIGDDTFVLYDDQQIETIRNAKNLGPRTRDEVKRIISKAQLYFPAVFTYDEKITGIGDYSDIPDLDLIASSQSWVPEGEFFGIALPSDWEREEENEAKDEKIETNKISNPVLLYDPNIVDKSEQVGFESSEEETIPFSSDGKIRIYTSSEWHNVQTEITLKSYQKQGVNYLQELWHKGYNGALLADDMGLGKTLQTLVFSSWVTEQTADEESMPIGIVAPVALLKNWQDEYEKFINPTLWGKPLVLHGGILKSYMVDTRPLGIEDFLEPGVDLSHVTFLDIERIKQHKLVIMTYETVRRYQLSLGALRWRILILDEAQKIKNPKSGVSMAIRGMNYEFALALTGTPVENSWVDLWTILSFCRNSRGISLQQFTKRFIKPVQSNPELIESIGEQLKAEIKPILLRRMKEDVLDELPKKETVIVKNPMPEEQWSLYQAILARRTNNSLGEGQDHIFKTIQQLRLASLHPFYYKRQNALLAMDNNLAIQSSARFVGLFKILDDIQIKNEKVLIFLRDKKIQQLLRSLIKNRYSIDVPPAVNGDLAGPRRQEIVKKFNADPGFRVLLLSAEAGGVGLNIIGANHVIHLSREWNPAKEDQATDRAYRIGQQKDVFVYYPLAIPTSLPSGAGFDEQLDALLTKKRNLSRKVIIPTELDDSEINLFSNNVLVNLDSNDNGKLITTAPVTIKDLQEYELVLIPLIIEWCCEATGYKALKCQKKKTGIDVLVYNPTDKIVYVLELVPPFASLSTAEQVRSRVSTVKAHLPTVLQENGFAANQKDNKIIVCFDAETEKLLIDDIKINPKLIWGPEKVSQLLEDANLRQSDVAVILNHNGYV